MQKKMKSLLTTLLKFIIFIALIGGIIFYFGSYNKAAFSEFVLEHDNIGLTELASKEIARKDSINRLNIPYEQKQALINKTVFIGATKQMVNLAISLPIRKTVDSNGHDKWFYIVDDSTTPIILTFNGEKLAKAERGTNLDIMDTN